MRLDIAQMVGSGMNEREIVDHYVKLYGPEVVADFAPTPGWATYLPWLITLLGGAGLAWWVRRMVRAHAMTQHPAA